MTECLPQNVTNNKPYNLRSTGFVDAGPFVALHCNAFLQQFN
jgi:hypothetical protein